MAGQNGAYCFKYVSIWTASFDAVFGQRLHLPKNATAFFGLCEDIFLFAPLFTTKPFFSTAKFIQKILDKMINLMLFEGKNYKVLPCRNDHTNKFSLTRVGSLNKPFLYS